MMSLFALFVAHQPLHPIHYPPSITFECRLDYLGQSCVFSECVLSRELSHSLKRMLPRWNSATNIIQSILIWCSYH